MKVQPSWMCVHGRHMLNGNGHENAPNLRAFSCSACEKRRRIRRHTQVGDFHTCCIVVVQNIVISMYINVVLNYQHTLKGCTAGTKE